MNNHLTALNFFIFYFFKKENQVLEAPAIQDDFYLNLVDWSALNVVAVAYTKLCTCGTLTLALCLLYVMLVLATESLLCHGWSELRHLCRNIFFYNYNIYFY